MRPFPAVFSALLVSAGAYAWSHVPGGPVPQTQIVVDHSGVLTRVGLAPEALAASGVTALQVAPLVAALAANFNEATLRTLDETYISAKATLDQLERKARSGLASPEDLAALAQARVAFSSAESARQTYLTALRDAALATLSPTQASTVRGIQQNSAWDLSVPYLVSGREEADWVRLRDALSTKKISEQYPGSEFPASVQTYLAAVDSEPAIAAAKANLDANLAAIQAAWGVAAGD